MYIWLCALEFAEAHSCLRPLHREGASRSRPKCHSHKASVHDPAQESSALTQGCSMARGRWGCGRTALLCSQGLASLMWMYVFMDERGQPKCHSQVVLGDMSRWNILRGLSMNTPSNCHKESHIIVKQWRVAGACLLCGIWASELEVPREQVVLSAFPKLVRPGEPGVPGMQGNQRW